MAELGPGDPAATALKLHELVQQLSKGEVPAASDLMKTMALAADILTRTPEGEK